MKSKIKTVLSDIFLKIFFIGLGLFVSGLITIVTIYFFAPDVYIDLAVISESPFLVGLTTYENYVQRGKKYISSYTNLPYQEFSVPKPDKVYRVFLFGGSQAMGEPYVHEYLVSKQPEFKVLDLPEQGGIATWLEKYLQKIHTDKKVEVINSAIGGGTFSQALFAFLEILPYAEPDLCIFLSGNNECNAAAYINLRKILKKIPSMTYEKRYSMLINYLKWHYQKKINIIKRVAEKENIMVYLLTVPNNLKDWSPTVGDSDKHLKNLAGLNIKGPMKMDELKKRLNDSDFDYPHIYHYLIAENYYKKGQYEKAWEHFNSAKDESLGMTRSHSSLNQLIRQVKSPNVKPIDLEMLIRKYAENSIPGFDLFFDACHLKLKSNNFMAYETAKKHAALINRPDIELKLLDLKNFEMKRLKQLYRIKTQKWDAINRLKRFKNLGKSNIKNVQRQYEEAQIELESVEKLINTIEDQNKKRNR